MIVSVRSYEYIAGHFLFKRFRLRGEKWNANEGGSMKPKAAREVEGGGTLAADYTRYYTS